MTSKSKTTALATVLLAAVVTSLLMQHQGKVRLHREIHALRSQAESLRNENQPPSPTPSGARSQPPLPAVPARLLDWRMVESPDYRQYIANLRAIGCPEQTIRDIVLADVNQLYRHRLPAPDSIHAFSNWWKRPFYSKEQKEKENQALAEQLQSVQVEKKAVIATLLDEEAAAQAAQSNLSLEDLKADARYLSVPENKRARVREVLEEYRRMETELRPGPDGMMNGSQVQELCEQARQELAQVLTPEELFEYDLRHSPSAQELWRRFGGFDLTEDEYRALFRLRQTCDQARSALPPATDPEAAHEAQQAMRRQLEQEYRSVLGEERYTESQWMEDWSWRDLHLVAQQHPVAPEALQQAYALKKQMDAEAAPHLTDPSMTWDDRSAVLKQLRQEYEPQIRALLGDEAFADYERLNGLRNIYYASPDGNSIVTVGGAPRFW